MVGLSNNELIQNKLLDKDVQNMFYPLNLMQNLNLNSKYSIRDKFVTPHGWKYFIVVFFIIFSALIFGSYSRLSSNLNVGLGIKDVTSLIVHTVYWFVFYICGYVLFFVLNVINRKNNVSLILTIQRIYKNIEYNEFNKIFTKWNWISVIIVTGVDMTILLLYTVVTNIPNINVFLGNLSFHYFVHTTFDIHMMYAIRVIILLKKYLDKWSEHILNMSYDEENDEYCEKMYNVYENILSAYNLYTKIYNISILYHTLDNFCRTLSYVKLLIQTLKLPKMLRSNSRSGMLSSVVVLWLAKNMGYCFIPCVHTERFYLAVEDAESACIERVKNGKCPESQETLCRSVVQLNRSSFKKMSACGLFNIDASLPLYLLELITNYVLVLLQITIL